MKKIYFMAVNWEQLKNDREHNYNYVRIYDKGVGESVPTMDGWMLYAFLTKKDRDQVVNNTLAVKE